MRCCLLSYFQNITSRCRGHGTRGRVLRDLLRSLEGPKVAPRRKALREHTGKATLLVSSFVYAGWQNRPWCALLCELCFVMHRAQRRKRARWPHLHAAGPLQWLQLRDSEQAISSHSNWPRVNSARQPRLAYTESERGRH